MTVMTDGKKKRQKRHQLLELALAERKQKDGIRLLLDFVIRHPKVLFAYAFAKFEKLLNLCPPKFNFFPLVAAGRKICELGFWV